MALSAARPWKFAVLVACAMPVCAAPVKPAVALSTTPVFEQPASDLLPKGYLAKRDTCSTDSAYQDSAGVAWFHVSAKAAQGWAKAADIRYVSDVPPDFFARRPAADEEMRRRAEEVKKHPDWPLRIRKAVHAGEVCIGMDNEQLAASWGQPQEKRTMYMLGVGEYMCFVFKGTSAENLLVSLQDGKVIGWSVE